MTADLVRIPDVMRGLTNLKRRFGPTSRAFRILALARGDARMSIGQVLQETAARHPERPAILFENRTLSYRGFNAKVNRMARALQAQGVRHGHAVAVLMENSPSLLIVVAATVKLGAIAALVNTSQRGEVLLHSLGLCKARALVAGPEMLDAVAEIKLDGLDPLPQCMFLDDSGQAAAPEGYLDLRELAAGRDASNPDTVAGVRLQDAAFYVFTSGTTGLPKASIMSHFRWVKAMAGVGYVALDMQPDDVFYCALPLYHNNALTLSWGAALSGGSALAIARKFSASRFWEDIHRHDASCFCYIGEFCRYLMAQPPSDLDRGHRVDRIMGNGLRPDIWTDFKARFGIDRVLEFYGASESNIAFVNFFNLDNTVGFCPVPYAIVRYDVENDRPVRNARGRLVRVKKGETGLLIGEVTDKTPYDGYTDPEASEKKLLRDVFRKGDCWFNTGDLMRELGCRHAQFVDRLGDTFRWKGENVSTTEVEQVLNEVDGVAQAVVYGVEVPGCDGRAGMACLVPEQGEAGRVDPDAVLRAARARLPAYAVPLFLRVRGEIETTATFKTMKTGLRADGFDPGECADPLYVLLPGEDAFRSLDHALFDAIGAGEYRF